MSASSPEAVSTNTLEQWLAATLQIDQFKDYSPNGLQVAGTPHIRHIVTGVTASLALIDQAIQQQADALIVHHGWFWKNESPCIRGPKRERVARVLDNNLNLFGYHLPLDAHPVLGNNAQLARILSLEPDTDDTGQPVTFGPASLIWSGRCSTQRTLADFAAQTATALDRQPLVVGDPGKVIKRVAWCTGGAQSMMQDAIDQGVDLYITGEASEQNFHMANESGVAFMAAGHHATERYGPKALGDAIAQQFGVSVTFIDLDNPI